MKNSIPSRLFTAKTLFNMIGRAMRNGKKRKNANNYVNMKTRVEFQIDCYDKAVVRKPITLENIHPLWTKRCDESITAHDMFESNPKVIQDLRNDLMMLNGRGMVYKCPLCEVNDVYHLDHYIPREKMPEYSIHPLNLIYICRECNEKKDTQWLDSTGRRIVFNAYYDKLSGKELLVCDVNSIVNGIPIAKIVENTSIRHNPESLRELSTLKNLTIDRMYERKVNEMLQTQCRLAVEQSRLLVEKGEDIDKAWDFLRKSYINMLNGPLDVISKFTYKGLANSTVMKAWLESIVSVV